MDGTVMKNDDELSEFSKRVAEETKAVSGLTLKGFLRPYRIVLAHIGLVSMINHSRKALNLIKFSAKHCSGSCDKPSECLQEMCKNVIALRDGIGIMNELIADAPVFPPLKRLFASTLAEWDELADDYTVACDPEIRQLLCQIADAV